MHSKLGSILKRWHSWTANPTKLQKKWSGDFYQAESDYLESVACSTCPSFDSAKNACGIGFGSPLRKCVVSSIEANFTNLSGKHALEIGFGRFMLAKNLIRRSGGVWTGIEPKIPPSVKPRLGIGSHGDAANIPFDDETFDHIFGIQSIEHWGQLTGGRQPSDYHDCLQEIHRALKPGGTIYFDAPIYFHGHEMFIANDLPRIRQLFDDHLWSNVKIRKWRERYTPLSRYKPSDAVVNNDWPVDLESYSCTELKDMRHQLSVYMIAITAKKKVA